MLLRQRSYALHLLILSLRQPGFAEAVEVVFGILWMPPYRADALASSGNRIRRIDAQHCVRLGSRLCVFSQLRIGRRQPDVAMKELGRPRYALDEQRQCCLILTEHVVTQP